MSADGTDIRRRLAGVTGLEVRECYPLSGLTTIGTGGRARWFAEVDRVTGLKSLMAALDMPWFVLGGGSNLLISDRDFPGLIIHLGRGFRHLSIRNDRIICGAAVPLSQLVRRAVDGAFPGFEELSGIPGTVGGAASMNAGTHLKDLGGLIERLRLVDVTGRARVFQSGGLKRGYRNSLAPVPGVVTSLTFIRGPGGDPAIQAERAFQLADQRRVKHPWGARTFGSTFKNPEGLIAAKLIDQSGLKGMRIGGARVSPVHANFIENDRGARALDILELIRTVRARVREKFGVSLEPEVRLLGFTGKELGDLAPYAVSTIKS